MVILLFVVQHSETCFEVSFSNGARQEKRRWIFKATVGTIKCENYLRFGCSAKLHSNIDAYKSEGRNGAFAEKETRGGIVAIQNRLSSVVCGKNCGSNCESHTYTR